MLCGTTNQTTLRRRLDFQIHQRALQSLGPFVLVWFCDAFWGRRRVQTGPIERVGNSSQDRPHVSAVRAPASAEPLYAANEVGTLERRIQRRISDGIRAKALVELLRSECLLFDMIISKINKASLEALGISPYEVDALLLDDDAWTDQWVKHYISGLPSHFQEAETVRKRIYDGLRAGGISTISQLHSEFETMDLPSGFKFYLELQLQTSVGNEESVFEVGVRGAAVAQRENERRHSEASAAEGATGDECSDDDACVNDLEPGDCLQSEVPSAPAIPEAGVVNENDPTDAKYEPTSTDNEKNAGDAQREQTAIDSIQARDDEASDARGGEEEENVIEDVRILISDIRCRLTGHQNKCKEDRGVEKAEETVENLQESNEEAERVEDPSKQCDKLLSHCCPGTLAGVEPASFAYASEGSRAQAREAADYQGPSLHPLQPDTAAGPRVDHEAAAAGQMVVHQSSTQDQAVDWTAGGEAIRPFKSRSNQDAMDLEVPAEIAALCLGALTFPCLVPFRDTASSTEPGKIVINVQNDTSNDEDSEVLGLLDPSKKWDHCLLSYPCRLSCGARQTTFGDAPSSHLLDDPCLTADQAADCPAGGEAIRLHSSRCHEDLIETEGLPACCEADDLMNTEESSADADIPALCRVAIVSQCSDSDVNDSISSVPHDSLDLLARVASAGPCHADQTEPVSARFLDARKRLLLADSEAVNPFLPCSKRQKTSSIDGAEQVSVCKGRAQRGNKGRVRIDQHLQPERWHAVNMVHGAFQKATGGCTHSSGIGFGGTLTACWTVRLLHAARTAIQKEFPELKEQKLQLLDIGLGSGSFLLIAALTGFFAHVWGIEFIENRTNILHIFEATITVLEKRMAEKQLRIPLTPIGMAWGNAAKKVDSLSKFRWQHRFWGQDQSDTVSQEGFKVVYSFCRGFSWVDLYPVWENVLKDQSVLFFIAVVDGLLKSSIQKEFLKTVNVKRVSFRVVECNEACKMHGSGSTVRPIMFARVVTRPDSECQSLIPLDSSAIPGNDQLPIQQVHDSLQETDSLLAQLQQLPGMTDRNADTLGRALERLTNSRVFKVIRREGPRKNVYVIRANAGLKPVDLLVEWHKFPRDNTAIFRIADFMRSNSTKRCENNPLPVAVNHRELQGNWYGDMLFFDKVHSISLLSTNGLEPYFEPVAEDAAVVFQKEGRLTQDFHHVVFQLYDALLFFEENRLSHNNLWPSAVMKRTLHPGSPPELVLTDLAGAQRGETTNGKTQGGHARRRGQPGVFKAVTWANDGIARSLEAGEGQPGFRAPEAKHELIFGARDRFAAGVMCILPMISKQAGEDEKELWQAVSGGELRHFLEYVLRRHRSLTGSTPGVQILEQIVGKVCRANSAESCSLTEKADRTMWFRGDVLMELLELSFRSLHPTEPFTVQEAFLLPIMAQFIPITCDEEQEFLFRGRLVPAVGEQKALLLLLVPGRGLVVYSIWNTMEGSLVCQYAGQWVSRTTKDCPNSSAKHGNRIVTCGPHAINAILNEDFTVSRYAAAGAVGAFVSSSRVDPRTKRPGNLSGPNWHLVRTRPQTLSRDHCTPDKAIVGLPMFAMNYIRFGTHMCWDYSWAQHCGLLGMSEAAIQKAMCQFADERDLSYVQGIIEQWRTDLTAQSGCQDDPEPAGEPCCPCLLA